MDLISTIYSDVKPERYTPPIPAMPDDQRARSKQLHEQLRNLGVTSTMRRLGGLSADPKRGPLVRELRDIEMAQGARYRDAGFRRDFLADLTHPVTGEPPRTMLRGWDERDAALKFWRRAYCA